MGDMVVTTDVDKLISLVERKKEISIEDAAKELGISSKTVESLGDLLEEEGIVHIKYKFTTPYLVHERQKLKEELPKAEEEEMFIEDELDIKKEFFSKAKARGATEEQARNLWGRYMAAYRDFIKKQFFDKARQKDYPERDIEKMWKKFDKSM